MDIEEINTLLSFDILNFNELNKKDLTDDETTTLNIVKLVKDKYIIEFKKLNDFLEYKSAYKGAFYFVKIFLNNRKIKP